MSQEKDLGEKLKEADLLEMSMALGMAPGPIQGRVDTLANVRPLSPGLADIQLAKVTRLGQRDRFPRCFDWENLIPALADGSELLWVVHKEGPNFSLYLGLKQNQHLVQRPDTVRNWRSGFRSLTNNFCRRAFPESHLEEIHPTRVNDIYSNIHNINEGHLTLVSGIPSHKALEGDRLFEERGDADRRPFASLNDALEPFLDEEQFCLVFSLTRAGPREILQRLDMLSRARETIHPHIKEQVGENTMEQQGGNRDVAVAKNRGENQAEQPGLHRKLWQMFAGSDPDAEYWGKSGVTYSSGETRTETSGTNWSKQTGTSLTAEHLNARLELVDESLQLSVHQLQQALGTGAYYGAVSVIARSQEAGVRIGRAVSGALSGSHSHTSPFTVVPYEGPGVGQMLTSNMPISAAVHGVRMLNTSQAGLLLMLPEAELPGLSLKRNVFYGRAVAEVAGRREPPILIGRSAFLEPSMESAFPRGAEEDHTEEEQEIRIEGKDILSHVLIAGTTGSGKSVRARKLVERLDFDRYRLIVVETAKKGFRKYLRRQGREPTVYSLGARGGLPLRINPFYFDPGTSLKRHVSVVADALSDLMPVEALIGPKMRQALMDCYFDAGWDVETGEHLGLGDPVYPTMVDFNMKVSELCERLGYSTEINQNYLGALQGRAQLFIDDLYQDIFAVGGEQPFETMFAGDTIVELDDLPPSEINMPAFVVSLLLQRLRAYRSLKPEGALPLHILVIEEAHNILGREQEEQKDSRQVGGSRHLLKQVVRLLQEGRELGIGVVVVDQSPRSLASAVLKNTNTKLVHRLVDGEELEVVGRAIGLEEEEWSDMGHLGDGECIASLKRGGRPIKLAPFRKQDLGEAQDLSLKESKPLPYAPARRLLEGIHREPGSLSTLDNASDELLNLCKADLPLLNYVTGRFHAWLSKDERKGMIWRPAADFQEWEAYVFGLAQKKLDAGEELDRLLLADLAGKPDATLIKLSGVGEVVFGERWVSLQAGQLARQVAAFAQEVCGDPEPVQKLARALVTWGRSMNEGLSLEDTSRILGVLLLDPERAQVFTAVLLNRHWIRKPPSDADLDYVTSMLAAGYPSPAEARLSELVPGNGPREVRQLFLDWALAQIKAHDSRQATPGLITEGAGVPRLLGE